MRRIAALILAVSLAAAGCSSASSACAPVKDGVGVCLQGKAVAWSPKLKPPHMHESGGYYGPAEDLAKALGVTAQIAADKKSVRVGGKNVAALTPKAMGIHQHDAAVYVPIKEFAEAAGYLVQVDTGKHTLAISKP
ncbi:MAG TPA: hypothetical protein VK464_14185 [Symbiobacteriaceae bacterium]|jgi:hypothetical protein|nr:hypothetical protein [Symbiobacteriaceae bacterium]